MKLNTEQASNKIQDRTPPVNRKQARMDSPTDTEFQIVRHTRSSRLDVSGGPIAQASDISQGRDIRQNKLTKSTNISINDLIKDILGRK